MSGGYRAVGWNRQKKLYDLWLVAGVGLFLDTFASATWLAQPDATAETILIRGFGATALFLLHVILCIGPLCRLDRRFLPLLYNRRHLGVTMFLLAATHGLFATFQFHALGDRPALLSLLTSPTGRDAALPVPFELLGLVALVLLFLMAATSHDFWLTNLTAPVWKALHMGVYLAYACLVLHVALGTLQAETNRVYTVVLALGLLLVLGLHAVAAWRERTRDRNAAPPTWFDVCAVAEIPEKRARVVCLGGERVAVFKYDGRISALSSVCRHQNGPLGEGCIVDGLVTCPWHGYQYRPEDGASPPPFTEKVPTFRVRVADGRVLVDPRPLPPGTRVEPARIEDAGGPAVELETFFVGYRKVMPAPLAAFLRPRLALLLAAGAGLALLLALPQRPFGAGRFDFGHVQPFEGALLPGASPTLLAGHPSGGLSRHLLCAPGKHGVEALLPPLEAAARVALRGTLIERDGRRMIEVEPGSVQVLGPDPSPSSVRDLGAFVLRGEIVDSKCYLGVMKPGQLKPHQACAVRCISGGIPPVLLVRDVEGRALYLLLEGEDGRALNAEVLAYVAVPIEVQGRVERRDDLLILRTEPATFRRL